MRVILRALNESCSLAEAYPSPKAPTSTRGAALSHKGRGHNDEQHAPWLVIDAALPRDHLDLAIDAVDDVEGALIDLALVLGDRAVFAFGEHHLREGANRFLDDVAARRDHRPGGVGKRLAALVGNELQRDDGGAVGDSDVG